MPLNLRADFASLRDMRRVRHVPGAVLVVCLFLMSASPGEADASSPRVAALQSALKSRGLYPVAVDGMRGPFTKRGVRRFQRRRDLLVDGVAGPQTRRALGRAAARLGARMPLTAGECAAGTWRRCSSCSGAGATRPAASTASSAGAPAAAVLRLPARAGLGADGLPGRRRSARCAARLHVAAPLRRTVGRCASSGPCRGRSAMASAPGRGGRRHSGIDFPVGSARASGRPAWASLFAGRNTGGYGNLS